jgi:hydrogenase expression/formation protein HypD
MMRSALEISEILARLNTAAARLHRRVQLMEICGTHTVAAFRSGLHRLVPPNVTLLSGPGCPVCVTSQGDINSIMELSLMDGVTVCTYGDMLRVTGTSGSLEDARGRGAEVHVIFSALDAVRVAERTPSRQVVLAAVGFETTTPATAVAVMEARRRGLANFSVLASHKLVMPAMRALLDSGKVNVDGFVCPGHVAVVIGSDAFRPIVEEYGLPCVVAGFEGPHIAAAMARLVEMVATGRPALENMYPQAVTRAGNRLARAMITQVFELAPAYWRGLGLLPDSGLALRPEFSAFDARVRFALSPAEHGDPAGCRCGEVICGMTTPDQCKLFGTVCTPVRPVGPCMVSSEGTCQAWFKYRRPRRRAILVPSPGTPGEG